MSVHSAGTHTTQATATIQPQISATTARVEKVRRPTVTAAGSSEDWAYFVTRWQDYVEATKIEGKDMIIQLLECCDEQLRKDLTRNAGGSLTNNTADELLAAIKNFLSEKKIQWLHASNYTTCAKTKTRKSVVLVPDYAAKQVSANSTLNAKIVILMSTTPNTSS